MPNEKFRVAEELEEIEESKKYKFIYFDDIRAANLEANNNQDLISELIGEDKNGNPIYTHDIITIDKEVLVVHNLDGGEMVLLKYEDKIPSRVFIMDYKDKIVKKGNIYENGNLIKLSS